MPNPECPEELPIDRDIETRLTTTKNLTGIFNWVLEGYIMLKNCGYFTEPEDQKRITEEFKELSNPLLEFAKEVEINTEISNEQLYTKYKYWCEDSGHNALARNTFQKRIVKAFKEYRKDIEPYRNKKERGWQVKSDSNPFEPEQLSYNCHSL
jgi:phage/plasmid-associated DNA primase